MPRARDPNRDKAFEIWKEHNGEIKLKDIAEQLGVSEGTLRGWKAKDNWNVLSNETFQTNKRNAPNDISKETSRGSKGKRENRSGNPSPKNQFSHRNNPKLLHGLFSKFLHEEQIEIIQVMGELNLADQIWLQIEIKFSAIIRMQKIMWVEDSEEHLKELSGESSNEFGGSETYKISFAYERFESYIKAQTRAMAEYRNLVKQFSEMAHDEDERRLKLEQMQLNIDKSKAEIKQLTNETESSNRTIIVNDKEEMRRLMNERASR